MPFSELHAHQNNSGSDGFFVLFPADVDESLVNTDVQGKTKRRFERANQQADCSLAMPPEMGRFSLGFGFLVESDDTWHPTTILGDEGVVTEDDSSSSSRYRYVLAEDKRTPLLEDSAEAPCRRAKEVEEGVILVLSEPPVSANG